MSTPPNIHGHALQSSAHITWEKLPADRRDRFKAALLQLWQASIDAKHLQLDLWQFAVNVNELISAGLTGTDIRWLVAQGMLAQAEEDNHSGQQRSFRPASNLAITSCSCFVLTPKGLSFVNAGIQSRETTIPIDGDLTGDAWHPRWDANRRELFWGNELVKRFRTPAPCQELILTAFEEELWPGRIDDPLGGPCDDPQRRLHDTVRALNRNQKQYRIRFSRDGTGQGVIWEASCSLQRVPVPSPSRL